MVEAGPRLRASQDVGDDGTGVHAYDRTQPGVEVKLATTVDQLLAREIGKTSRIPSIEMSVDFPTQGSCDSGDCFYVNTVSWRKQTTPNNTDASADPV